MTPEPTSSRPSTGAVPGAPPVRVLVAEDVPELRRALVSWLSKVPGIEVVGDVGDGQEAVDGAAALLPDVVLMDVRMPNLDGIEATKIIASRHPEVAVLMLSAYGEESFILEALVAGARGYLLKESPPREVEQAVFRVAQGHTMTVDEPAPQD